jgi:hypothetical protein
MSPFTFKQRDNAARTVSRLQRQPVRIAHAVLSSLPQHALLVPIVPSTPLHSWIGLHVRFPAAISGAI